MDKPAVEALDASPVSGAPGVQAAEPPNRPPCFPRLTPLEWSISAGVAVGLSLPELAQLNQVSEAWVAYILEQLIKRLGLTDMEELAHWRAAVTGCRTPGLCRFQWPVDEPGGALVKPAIPTAEIAAVR